LIFCDTSTLAKYYVPEPENPAVRSRLDGAAQVALSELARIELMAAFHRQLREGKWTRRQFSAFVQQFTRDALGGQWTWLSLDHEIIDAGASLYLTLSAAIYLRASDCLHLVTALHHGFTEIHTHDRHQLRAASALGIKACSIA
jgi:predicted nucleic acid-binding protein